MFRGIFADASSSTNPALTGAELQAKIQEHKEQWEKAKNIIVQGGMIFWTSCLPGGLLINITSSVLSDWAKEPLLNLLTTYEPNNNDLVPWAKEYYIDLSANEKLKAAINEAKSKGVLPTVRADEPPLSADQQSQVTGQLRRLTNNSDINVPQLLDLVRAQGYSMQEFSKKLTQTLAWMEQKEKEALNEQALLGYTEFFDVLNTAGSKLNCKPLQVVSLAAKGFMAVQELARRMANFSQVAAQVGPIAAAGITLGGVGAIASVFMGLVECFSSSGPSPLQMLSDQILSLSSQIKILSDNLEKQLDFLYKQQKVMLDMMVQGFVSLNYLIQSNAVRQGIETNAKLEDIQAVLNFSVRVERLDRISEFNQQFETVFSRANLLLQHMLHDELPQRTADELVVCATSHAHNDIVTGVNLWAATAPRFTLEDIFSFTRQGQNILLNYMIGYLGRIYDGSLELTNPHLWARCVFFYLALVSNFPVLRETVTKQQLDILLKLGQQQLSILERLGNDEAFWNTLFDKYYQCLEAVKSHWHTFTYKQSQHEFNLLNIDYMGRADSDKRAPDTHDLDFYAPPNTLIDKCGALSTIPCLNQTINMQDINFRDHNYGKIGDSSVPIYRFLQERRDLLPNAALCVVYLKGKNFYTTQVGGIRGFSWDPGGILVPFVYPDSSRYVNPHDLVRNIRYTDFVNKITEWQADFQIMLGGQYDRIPICEFTYVGSYGNIASANIALYKTSASEGYRDGHNWFRYSMCSPAEEVKYGSNMADYIRGQWRNSEMRSANARNCYDEEGRRNIQIEIDRIYLEKRKAITKKLYDNSPQNGPDGEATAPALEFYRALDRLNEYTLTMHAFANLIGKNMEKSPLNNLLNRETIKAGLLLYVQQGSQLDQSGLDVVHRELSNRRLNFQTCIKQVENAGSLGESHPLARLNMGLSWLRMYRARLEFLNQKISTTPRPQGSVTSLDIRNAAPPTAVPKM